ncbi:hypothetical protein CTB91_04132 [Dickeya solani]|uniref:Uncharacterized protein n=1 Tax=Dickeya solani D s0432-1 TaxID=1231725 RepID=A0AAV3K9D7_9GAMM|nr:hypothetical protein CTB91_04132 [Dickeya solani]ERO57457.1 hypothetical protein A544_4048 [Dickeya solani D s0432-1]AYQ54018.1 hypothetical protein DSOL99_04130 [Dickeya solani]MBD3606442.1 hypothetical protein [Dickeya solani]NUA41999.1 hypothetical protein [Dickeya solani]
MSHHYVGVSLNSIKILGSIKMKMQTAATLSLSDQNGGGFEDRTQKLTPGESYETNFNSIVEKIIIATPPNFVDSCAKAINDILSDAVRIAISPVPPKAA